MKRILVIDDDADMLKIVSLILADAGYNVVTASDGNDGIKKFDEGHFNLVLTDIRMPDIDGNDVAKHIRNSATNEIPIIGISGTLWVLEDTSFDMIISKPFSTKSLIDSIAKMISTSK
jgi:CheY-like chemotaxis protein